ncbi:MAG: transcription termination/antitermination protein NusG [Coriobacteriales bacterium]|jgi:transcriptional antiterminator NusG
MSKRWYVIHTYSGYENKVKRDLEHRIEAMGVADRVVDIQIPTEEVTEVKEGGQQVTKESKVFPGYVLVRMEMDDHTWSVVRETQNVTGFLGTDGKPVPLTRAEYDKIMHRDQPDGQKPKRVTVDLEVGQSVSIVDGPFKGFDGTVADINPETGKVNVTVVVFNRETSIELTLDQVSTIL